MAEETKDPVCGMTIEIKRAKGSMEHQGQRYYFCSAGCQQKFKEEPVKYIKT